MLKVTLVVSGRNGNVVMTFSFLIYLEETFIDAYVSMGGSQIYSTTLKKSDRKYYIRLHLHIVYSKKGQNYRDQKQSRSCTKLEVEEESLQKDGFFLGN